MGQFFIVLVTDQAIFDISFFPLKYTTMNVTFMCPQWLWTMILAVALARDYGGINTELQHWT